jgi:3-methyladenine DNA glycosylase AlkD
VLTPASTVDEILAHLREIGSAENRAGMARYGIVTDQAFGVSNAVLRPIARTIKRDNDRSLALWESGWREARLLAAFTAEPKKFDAATARQWADDFNSWEVVDHAADLFCDAGLLELVSEFAADEREFVRRCGFAIIAWAAVHLKKEPDETFIGWLSLIEKHSHDGRNFVRKAVSWALRQTGKRSLSLHAPALALAERLATSTDKAERWVGKDAVKELTAEKTLERLKARAGK